MSATARSKLLDEDAIVSQLEDGMCIGIGGWGSRRKPMSTVAAIARSSVRDLTIVSCAGPDLGLLCATGKVRRAVYPFASLDTIPLEPHVRRARQAGQVEDEPWDEGMFLLGLQAAAWRVPFLPTRAGLGSDLERLNPRLARVRSPFPEPGSAGGATGAAGAELVAVPALTLDAAICHLNRADERGNACYLGPDLYFDDLVLRAAPARRFISVERVVATDQLLKEAGTELRLRIPRLLVDGVVERPGGAWFTSCDPDYPRDEELQRAYAATASDEAAWASFEEEWLAIDGAAFAAKVGASAGAAGS